MPAWLMRSGPTVALATHAGLPDLDPDDLELVAALRARGVQARPRVWSRDRDWADFDAVVLRSCWDYDRSPEAFRGWLDRLHRSGVTVWNEPGLVARYLDKRYLLDLPSKGISIPTTALLERGGRFDLGGWMDSVGCGSAVVKPTVSMLSRSTHLVSRENVTELLPLLHALQGQSELLAQAFHVPLLTYGETSFVFFDGRFSHAVRKQPARGDFRVQAEFGGSRAPVQPSDDDLAWARRVIGAGELDTTLYARVDAVLSPTGRTVMEIEAVDPSCYLIEGGDAPQRFAAVIAARLR